MTVMFTKLVGSIFISHTLYYVYINIYLFIYIDIYGPTPE